MNRGPNSSFVNQQTLSTLPLELIHALNQACLLHLLATDPESVLPPGKTPLSMLAHAQVGLPDEPPGRGGQDTALLGRVKEVAHKAFWTEALEALSSPIPSVQLPRLKCLYGDILEALSPLFPPNHQIVQALSLPFPPTSSPLQSARVFLKEIVVALRERCAPLRDDMVDELLRKLDDPFPVYAPKVIDANHIDATQPSSQAQPPSPLAQLLVDVMQSILSLVEIMKSDLSTFVLGNMTDAQLKQLVIEQAKLRERRVVLDIWGAQKSGGDHQIKEIWQSWLVGAPETATSTPNGIPEKKKWITALVNALCSDRPLSCDLPRQADLTREALSEEDTGQPQNQLPPQFLLSAPALLYIQNLIQAIVIAASLRSLTRLHPVLRSSDQEPHYDFMNQIWVLLKAEIDSNAIDNTNGGTKINNLADEVIRARTLSSGKPEPAEEAQLRAAVERTLRPQDPVFLLLLRRLMGAIEARLLSIITEKQGQAKRTFPVSMQTGRNPDQDRNTNTKWPRLSFPERPAFSSTKNASSTVIAPVVRGFEEPVLRNALEEVVLKLGSCVDWVEFVWEDSMMFST